MADHFSPVLYLFGLLYRFAPSPAWFFARAGDRAGRHRAADARRGPTLRPAARARRPSSSPAAARCSRPCCSTSTRAPWRSRSSPRPCSTRCRTAPPPPPSRRSAPALCRADLALVLLAIALVAAPRAACAAGGGRRGGGRGQRGRARPVRRDERLGAALRAPRVVAAPGGPPPVGRRRSAPVRQEPVDVRAVGRRGRGRHRPAPAVAAGRRGGGPSRPPLAVGGHGAALVPLRRARWRRWPSAAPSPGWRWRRRGTTAGRSASGRRGGAGPSSCCCSPAPLSRDGTGQQPRVERGLRRRRPGHGRGAGAGG